MASKNSYKEFDNEKKFLPLEIPLPQNTFLMVCPLVKQLSKHASPPVGKSTKALQLDILC